MGGPNFFVVFSWVISACTSALEVGNETAVTKRERTIHREAEITQEKTTKKIRPRREVKPPRRRGGWRAPVDQQFNLSHRQVRWCCAVLCGSLEGSNTFLNVIIRVQVITVMF